MTKPMITPATLIEYGSTVKTFAPGQVIFEEGSHCSHYLQIAKGRVRWVNINEEGKEYLQSLLEVGECFGELPLFDDEPYAASAIAEETCEIIRLPREAFRKLIIDHPEVHFAFSALLTQRVRHKFFVAKEIANNDPEQRIIALLDYLKSHHKNVCEKCGQVKLTRQHIADMSGLRVETVIRTMRGMHNSGKVSIVKGRVFLPLENMTAVICNSGSC